LKRSEAASVFVDRVEVFRGTARQKENTLRQIFSHYRFQELLSGVEIQCIN